MKKNAVCTLRLQLLFWVKSRSPTYKINCLTLAPLSLHTLIMEWRADGHYLTQAQYQWCGYWVLGQLSRSDQVTVNVPEREVEPPTPSLSSALFLSHR